MSVLRAGAHECQIRSASVLVLPRLQMFSITLKRRQRAKIKFILALCQPSETRLCRSFFRSNHKEEITAQCAKVTEHNNQPHWKGSLATS
ncbi:hypothetical protein FZC69_01075 [Bacillus altitudinis]|nr:hypothetical protein FZC69_01075 [Bacillus altitudinis]